MAWGTRPGYHHAMSRHSDWFDNVIIDILRHGRLELCVCGEITVSKARITLFFPTVAEYLDMVEWMLC